MADGNTAALRAHEAQQDRLARQAPTDTERESFIDDFLEKKAKKLGTEFLREALAESDDADLSPLFIAYQTGGALEIGLAMREIVAAYWRPAAITAADEHNFDEDRAPCRCRGDCYC
jgi:hypothetical protein